MTRENFIQFYDFHNKTYFLQNGFSSVWNVIKERGNILWVNHKDSSFPNVEGIVYISASMDTDFSYIEKWVKYRPDIKFIVGGPAVNYMNFNLNYKNFYAEKRYMFELLNIIPSVDDWNLVIPEVEDNLIYYILFIFWK